MEQRFGGEAPDLEYGKDALFPPRMSSEEYKIESDAKDRKSDDVELSENSVENFVNKIKNLNYISNNRVLCHISLNKNI